MHYQIGIFNNFIKTHPTEMEHMFEAVEYIINQGSGGDILDQLSKKSFKDTKQEYINRIKKESLAREDGLFIIYQALLKWYETWKDSFNQTNLLVKYKEQPIHTWLHCFLTGQLDVFQRQKGEEYVLIEKGKWEEIQKNAMNTNRSHLPPKQEQNEVTEEKMKRLIKLYKMDEDLKYKELLLEKRMAIFLEETWTEEQINEIQKNYHLKAVKLFPSIESTNNIGFFGYYLFLTSKASHTAKFKLESQIPKENLFLIGSTNYKLVINQFIEQLKGRTK